MTVLFRDAVSEALPAIDTTIYSCPLDADSAQLIAGNCNNPTGAAATLTVNIVQSSGIVATTNEYISATSITAGTSNPLSEIGGLVLQPGDFVSANPSAAATLNFKISIKEVYS